MKLIVDVGVGNAVERLLRESGHDVLSVRDMDPSMPDAEILSVAVAESRLLITMDKDYGELVYHRVREHAGVLLLRLDSSTGSQKATVVRDIFEQHGEALPGRFSVYQGGLLRMRQESSAQQDDATDDASRRS